uniref:Uncharacterized protein n=1 Tax=uncultured Nocardioidaceae bacterium TaxID=253824 RepID=A0A6J4L979_9ACTN|nr:MAG: hypothetical protein AVDCRST_MAG46-1139 [uncultured Nocardioidaceae bacterium]
MQVACGFVTGQEIEWPSGHTPAWTTVQQRPQRNNSPWGGAVHSCQQDKHRLCP